VIAALGPQAGKDLATLLHHAACLALDQGEEEERHHDHEKTRLSMR
jgi:hypothetical protein